MIGVVGINHKSAPVRQRERFVFSENEIEDFIKLVRKEEPFAEIVVLSTCNRTEIYFNLPNSFKKGDCDYMLGKLARFKELDLKEDLHKHFYTHKEDRAVNHLFTVAAGLNSMVLGENQILGQVKDAYRISSSRKFTGPVLNRLFHKAFEVGKRVRTETAINEGASSISYAAVELSSKIFNNLSAHPVLLIGAGETGELVLQSLVQRGCHHLHIANRTFRRAQQLAKKYEAEPVRLEDFGEYFLHCDIIVTSTTSPTPLIRSSFMQKAMQDRQNRTIFLIDLSVPRDIAEEVKEIENVFVYDIDDMEAVVAHNYEKRKGEIEKANEIIAKHKKEFLSWLSTLSLAPTIELLKNKFETMSQKELESLKNKMSEDAYERVFEFAAFLQGKYLGLVIKNLKTLSDNGKRLEYIDLVNNLFELKREAKK